MGLGVLYAYNLKTKSTQVVFDSRDEKKRKELVALSDEYLVIRELSGSGNDLYSYVDLATLKEKKLKI